MLHTKTHLLAQYERNTSFRWLVNVASCQAYAAKLSSIVLQLNASKLEYALDAMPAAFPNAISC